MRVCTVRRYSVCLLLRHAFLVGPLLVHLVDCFFFYSYSYHEEKAGVRRGSPYYLTLNDNVMLLALVSGSQQRMMRTKKSKIIKQKKHRGSGGIQNEWASLAAAFSHIA